MLTALCSRIAAPVVLRYYADVPICSQLELGDQVKVSAEGASISWMLYDMEYFEHGTLAEQYLNISKYKTCKASIVR